MKWFCGLLVASLAFAEAPPSADEIIIPSQEELSKFVQPDEILKNSSRGGGVSCKDILLSAIPAPTDPDTNLIVQMVYTLCIMEMTMQKYIDYQEQIQKKDHPLISQARQELAKLQKILPTFLTAYKAAEEAFTRQGLRQNLNDQRQDYNNSGN